MSYNTTLTWSSLSSENEGPRLNFLPFFWRRLLDSDILVDNGEDVQSLPLVLPFSSCLFTAMTLS